MYTPEEFPLDDKYISILTNLYITAFFSVIFPYVIVLQFFGLLILYWLDKHYLIHACSINVKYGHQLSQRLFNMVNKFLPLYSISYMFFSYFVNMNQFVYFAMENMDINGNYFYNNWKFFYLKSDLTAFSNYDTLKDFDAIVMLDTFISLGIFGLLISLSNYVLSLNHNDQDDSQLLATKLDYNQAKFYFETDYDKEQDKKRY